MFFDQRGKQQGQQTVSAQKSSLDHLLELVAPFTEENKAAYALYLNIISVNPALALSTVQGSTLEVNPKTEERANLAACRGILLSNANIVAAESTRSFVSDYLQYAEQLQLISPSSEKRVTWVKNTADLEGVLKKLHTDGRGVLPYFQGSALLKLADQLGCAKCGSTTETGSLIDAFYDKVNYRQLLRALHANNFTELPCAYRQATLPDQLSNYQRPMSLEAFHLGMQAAVDYNLSYGSHPGLQDGRGRRTLFVQCGHGASGRGNRIVLQNDSGGFIMDADFEKQGQPASFKSLDQLSVYLYNAQESIQVTPYVPIRKSYSFSIQAGETGVAVVGPFEQILDEKLHYLGSRLDTPSEAAASFYDLQHQRDLSTTLANFLQRAGYRGWASEDIVEATDPNGNPIVFRAELNLRMAAPTLPLGYLIRRADLAERLLKGEVALYLETTFPVDTRLFKEQLKNTVGVYNYLDSGGIPLMSATEDKGLFLFGPAMLFEAGTAGEYVNVPVCVVASSAEARDAYLSKTRALLNPPAHKEQ